MAKYDSDITGWVTVGGRRIPLRKGESKKEAIAKNVKRGEGKTRTFYQHSKHGRAYADNNSQARADEHTKQMKKEGWRKIKEDKVGIKSAHKKRKEPQVVIKHI